MPGLLQPNEATISATQRNMTPRPIPLIDFSFDQ
jgi:hypothetical protein